MMRQIQLGKNGITENFINSLKDQFNDCRDVKVSVLASATRDKKELRKIEEKILDKLGKKFTAKTIGFTIALKRWRRDKRE